MTVYIQLDKIVGFLIYLFVGINLIYIFATKKTTDIIVRKKLTIVSWGFTKYIIIDSNGQIFEISNSLWFGSGLNDWVKIKLNKKYTIGYFGVENKFLGTMFQIVDIE